MSYFRKPKHLKLASIIGFSTVVISSILLTSVANAAPFNRAAGVGYFKGNYFGGIGNGLFTTGGGFENVTSAAQLEIDVNDYLHGYTSAGVPDPTNQAKYITGAEFLMAHMLGYPAGSAQTYTASEQAAWVNLINGYSKANEITFDQSYTYTTNTAWDGQYNDVYWFPENGTDDSIVFKNAAGNPVYVIKRTCGNPLGDFTSLPPPPAAPTWSLTGSSTVVTPETGGALDTGTNNIVKAGDTVVFHHDVTNNGPNTATYSYRVNPTYATPATSYSRAQAGTLSSGAGQVLAITGTIVIPANTGSSIVSYCQSISYSPAAQPGTAGGITSQVCVQVAPSGPPTLEGYKIDTNGDHDNVAVGGVDRGSYPFSDDKVEADVGATPYHTNVANPFYFQNCSGGCPSGTYNTQLVAGTTYTIKVSDTGTSDGAWTVEGYRLCDSTAVSTCAAAFDSSGSPLTGLGSSFSFTPQAGHIYQMRWVYQIAPACGNVTSLPNPLQPNQPTTLTFSLNTPVGSAAPGAINYTAFGSSGTATEVIPSPTYTAEYQVSLTSPPTISNDPVTWGSGSLNCTGTVAVSDLPYVQSYGGEVATGADIEEYSAADPGDSCANATTTDSNAGIDGWNNDGTPNYGGAGSQFGAQAMSIIEGFASAQQRTSTPAAPSGLTFANSIGGVTYPSGTQFGGDFASAPACASFQSGQPTTATVGGTIDLSTISQPETYNSSVTINASTIPAGTHLSLYVEGNVTITGNILYGDYSALSNIPSLKIVAEGGSIFISNAATELDGLFVAEQDTADHGGAIYTCTEGLNGISDPTVNGASEASQCGHQLVVNGSFVASSIKLLRTCGTLDEAGSDSDITTTDGSCDSANHAAEVFNYGPEEWLGQQGNVNDNQDQAITSLPPVL